jgi:hypothetical protein
MFSDNLGFSVSVEQYAERHYIKEFNKKYGSWKITWKGLLEVLSRFDAIKLGSVVEMISQNSSHSQLIYKYEFRIAEQQVSAKASGNRMIILVDTSIRLIRVLLVYHKNNVRGSRETDWWKGEIKNNYPELSWLN